MLKQLNPELEDKFPEDIKVIREFYFMNKKGERKIGVVSS